MIDQGTNDSYNDCHNVLDFDDSDVLMSNNFDTHSCKENNNIKNGEMQSNIYGQIERLSNEKVLIQNQCNSKMIDLQAQIMKLTNNFERIETSKTELEVELTKCHKDLRQTQRNFQIKSNELENLKIEFSNKLNSLESDYMNKISHANNLNKSLQEQICEEKRNNKNNQDFLSDKINQMFSKIKEKDEELSKNLTIQNHLQKTLTELEQQISHLTKKIEESDHMNAFHQQELHEKKEQIESLRNSELKLKSLVTELTRKVTVVESKMFEEKHELNESKSYQNNLQAQLLDLQQAQVIKEKEYNILLDRITISNKKIKELEEALSNQMQISSNYHEHLKKFENKQKIQSIDIKDQNENLARKVAQLEETIKIQSRIIEETNEELSTSRECEGTAVSNLNLTLEELDKLIEEPKMYLKSPGKSRVIGSPKIVTEFLNDSFLSPSNSCLLAKSGDHCLSPTPNKRIIRNVKQIIRDFQEQIRSLDNDKLEGIDKIQTQDKEIKNLKIQVRKYTTQNKALEIDNTEKQSEIENLTEEISKLKSLIASLKIENAKNKTNYKENVENLKSSIVRVSEESQNNIESRDKYLQNISMIIKEALQNNFTSYLDWPKFYGCRNSNFTKSNLESAFNESATQTHFADNIAKENLELTGNMTGTFCFSNQLNPPPTTTFETNLKPVEKRSRIHENNHDKKAENRIITVNDERKKSAKKVPRLPDGKKDPYVDSAQSWPALREVISNELSALLGRCDIQRAQCHNLMSELSTKENIIARLLAYQNSSSFNNQGPVDTTSQCPNENAVEIPTNNNKTLSVKPNFSNQNNQTRSNIDLKKKTKVSLKSRVDNMSSNTSNKRCNKVENQKPDTNSQMNRIGKFAHTNKRATTISTKIPERSIGSPSNNNPTMIQLPTKSSVNNLCVTKPIIISLPSTPPVTSRCRKTVNDESPQFNELIVDQRLTALILGTLINVIHLRSELETNKSLIKFYKLLYLRSVDCSQLISVNEHLECMISRSHLHSRHVNVQRKPKRFRIYAHVVMACCYISKRLLASKLIICTDPEVMISDDLKGFVHNVINSVPDSFDCDLVSKDFLDSILNDFVNFCFDHNNRYLLVSKPSKCVTSNIRVSSNTIVLDKLKSNVHTIQTIIETQISKKFYMSKKKLYQNDVQTLIVKIKEMGQIIDVQNLVIEQRQNSIVQLEEKLIQQNDENLHLISSMRQVESLNQLQILEIESLKLLIDKTKAYLIGLVEMCNQYSNCEIFNCAQLMEEEASIFHSIISDDCNDFINFVRNGIRAALRLSCSVKSIFI